MSSIGPGVVNMPFGVALLHQKDLGSPNDSAIMFLHDSLFIGAKGNCLASLR